MPVQINSLDNSNVSNESSASNIVGTHCSGNNSKGPLANQITNQLDNYCFIKKNQILVSKTDVSNHSS